MPQPLAAAVAATACFTLCFVQDPPPAPTPPAPVPAAAPSPAQPTRHPLEGVYVLRKRFVQGRQALEAGRGHLALTGRHLFLCFVGPGPDPDHLLVRTGVRTWQAVDDRLRTTVELGWFTDEDGGVHIEAPGTVEVRRIVHARGVLRVHQDELSWLEFERVE